MVKLLLFIILLGSECLAQDSVKTLKLEHPKPDATIFFNYHTALHANHDEFEIQRAYLGLSQKLDDHWSATIRLDIGSSNDLPDITLQRRYAYFRKAAIAYTYHNFEANIGIIDLLTFKNSDQIWGKRYLRKSMQDLHKFGASADLGVMAKYEIKNYFLFDIAYVNGEGYNHIQKDNTFKFCTGVTFIRFKPIIIRLYNDLMHKNLSQTTSSILLGYDYKRIQIGSEIVMRRNDEYQQKYHKYGTSHYITINAYKKFNVFGRYDYLWSEVIDNTESAWNQNWDGFSFVGGIEYLAHTYIRFSLNYQDWHPANKLIDNESFIYFNIEVKLK